MDGNGKIKGEWKNGEFYPDFSSVPLSYWKELDKQSKASIDNWLVEQFEISHKNIAFFIQMSCFVAFTAMGLIMSVAR